MLLMTYHCAIFCNFLRIDSKLSIIVQTYSISTPLLTFECFWVSKDNFISVKAISNQGFLAQKCQESQESAQN